MVFLQYNQPFRRQKLPSQRSFSILFLLLLRFLSYSKTTWGHTYGYENAKLKLIRFYLSLLSKKNLLHSCMFEMVSLRKIFPLLGASKNILHEEAWNAACGNYFSIILWNSLSHSLYNMFWYQQFDWVIWHEGNLSYRMFSNNCHFALRFILVGDADVYHTRDSSVTTDKAALPRALLTADFSIGRNQTHSEATFRFCQFSQKLHEMERIWTPNSIM